jgi:hypothetical protein
MGWPNVLVGLAVVAGQAPQLPPPFPEGSTPRAVFASAGPVPAGPAPGGGGRAVIFAIR